MSSTPFMSKTREWFYCIIGTEFNRLEFQDNISTLTLTPLPKHYINSCISVQYKSIEKVEAMDTNGEMSLLLYMKPNGNKHSKLTIEFGCANEFKLAKNYITTHISNSNEACDKGKDNRQISQSYNIKNE
eukprot:422971_1